MNAYAYVRVSTTGQSYETQIEQIKTYCTLKGYEVVRVFCDKMTGSTTNRAGFQEMLSNLEDNPSEVEAVLVTRLDRVGRSIRDLLRFVDWCSHKNINLIAISNNIDTTTKEGRLFLYLMSALSEYERELIQERTERGRARFRENGGSFGRPRKPINLDRARLLLAEGIPKARVARQLKISRWTLHKRLEQVPPNEENNDRSRMLD